MADDTADLVGRFSDLIGSIYDCVLDPGKWEPLLQTIAAEFSFRTGVLGIVPLRAGKSILTVNVGFDPEWLAAIADEQYRAESVKLWGGESHLARLPLDEPFLGSQSPGFAARQTNKYYRDILAPRDVLDAIAIITAREPALLGYLGFDRHRSAGPVGETELAALRLLGPHFRRAVTISNLFDLKGVEAASFAEMFEALAFGVVLVDEDLGIIHANLAARAMFEASDPIRSERGRLTLSLDAAQAALARAVQQAADDEAELGIRGIGIPARREEGDPCVVHVLPLRRGVLRRGLAPRAAAALFIAPRTIEPSLPADALGLLYDLTPAEVRVFELVVNGRTNKEISHELGIAPSTLKTHLLRVFEKTGRHTRSDLVRLAREVSLPV